MSSIPTQEAPFRAYTVLNKITALIRSRERYESLFPTLDALEGDLNIWTGAS